MKPICTEIMYCVQWYREDMKCELYDKINDCPNFNKKLEEYGIACRKSYPWRTAAIERYLGKKLRSAEDTRKLLDAAGKFFEKFEDIHYVKGTPCLKP